ncbi:MAG: hypothetical protein IKN70_00845 [Fibrobacter sp.]|nr:hypothetical protein [Fibrobacter sp.]
MSKKESISFGIVLPETQAQIKKEVIERITLVPESMMGEVSLKTLTFVGDKINLSFTITCHKD